MRANRRCMEKIARARGGATQAKTGARHPDWIGAAGRRTIRRRGSEEADLEIGGPSKCIIPEVLPTRLGGGVLEDCGEGVEARGVGRGFCGGGALFERWGHAL